MVEVCGKSMEEVKKKCGDKKLKMSWKSVKFFGKICVKVQKMYERCEKGCKIVKRCGKSVEKVWKMCFKKTFKMSGKAWKRFKV